MAFDVVKSKQIVRDFCFLLFKPDTAKCKEDWISTGNDETQQCVWRKVLTRLWKTTIIVN
jgi:hypothetical protein